jgi:hypothetical protein
MAVISDTDDMRGLYETAGVDADAGVLGFPLSVEPAEQEEAIGALAIYGIGNGTASQATSPTPTPKSTAEAEVWSIQMLPNAAEGEIEELRSDCGHSDNDDCTSDNSPTLPVSRPQTQHTTRTSVTSISGLSAFNFQLSGEQDEDEEDGDQFEDDYGSEAYDDEGYETHEVILDEGCWSCSEAGEEGELCFLDLG